MDTLELLTQRINALEETINEVSDQEQNDELNQLIANGAIIKECLEVLKSEDLIINFKFDGVISLIEGYDIDLNKLKKIISDIKTALGIKREMAAKGIAVDDIALSQNQTATLEEFIEILKKIEEDLEKKQMEILKSSDKKDDTEALINGLTNLKEALSSNRRRKKVTSDMVTAVYNGFDLLNANPEMVEGLMKDLYASQGVRIHREIIREDIEEVINLYKRYVSADKFELVEKLIYSHRDEIVTHIDLDKAKEILDFFKEKGILDKFTRSMILQISIYGRTEYVKEVYEKVKNETKYDQGVYFEDLLTSVWICEGRAHRKDNKHKFKIKKTKTIDTHLYACCFEYSLEEFKENVDLLVKISSKLPEKYRTAIQDLGAQLSAVTSPSFNRHKTLVSILTSNTWTFRKNLGITKSFGLSDAYDIPPSFFKNGDTDEKIHWAIELGLLNPPLTPEYLAIDLDIPKADQFNKNHPATNIRNYYVRFMSKLSGTSNLEYAIMADQLNTVGKKEFYQSFFSRLRAGEGSNIYSKGNSAGNTDEKYREFVSRKFATNWYAEYVDNFDQYDSDISNYDDEVVGGEEEFDGYYDSDILNDPIVQELENKHCINDITMKNGERIERKNEYVYMFGDTIISRYKVLHNLSILKKYYPQINDDMLITAIVRNSHLTDKAFEKIHDEVYNRRASL